MEQEMDFRAGDPLAKLSFLAKTFPAASLVSARQPTKGRNAKQAFSCRKRMDGVLQVGSESPRQP